MICREITYITVISFYQLCYNLPKSSAFRSTYSSEFRTRRLNDYDDLCMDRTRGIHLIFRTPCYNQSLSDAPVLSFHIDKHVPVWNRVFPPSHRVLFVGRERCHCDFVISPSFLKKTSKFILFMDVSIIIITR